jgi:hypothetical protein
LFRIPATVSKQSECRRHVVTLSLLTGHENRNDFTSAEGNALPKRGYGNHSDRQLSRILETGHFLFSRPARKFISQFFKQSSDVYVPSTTAEEYLVQTPKHDSLKKYSSDPSTNVVKVWTDPTKAKDKGRRRVAEQWRRESKKSDTSIRTKRVLGNVVDLQAARHGADAWTRTGGASLRRHHV